MTEPTVLVMDDQLLIAFETAQLLERNGFNILGPYRSVDDALAGLRTTKPDAAILDINMGHGTTSEPIAEELTKLDLPFAFLTGYGSGDILSAAFKHVKKLQKPARPEELVSLVKSMTAAPKSAHG